MALATPSFSEALIERRPDGSLPPQTPELLSKMVPPMFEALQRTLAPLLVEEQGRLQEPAFVQVGGRDMPCACGMHRALPPKYTTRSEMRSRGCCAYGRVLVPE